MIGRTPEEHAAWCDSLDDSRLGFARGVLRLYPEAAPGNPPPAELLARYAARTIPPHALPSARKAHGPPI